MNKIPHVEKSKGIKFVYLSGKNPYEIGFHHGKLLKKEIKNLVEGVKDYLHNGIGKTKYSFTYNILIIVSSILARRNFNRNQIEQMRGISEGSSQKLEYIYIANMIFELASGFSKYFQINACSAFMKYMRDYNEVLFAKTTDLGPFLAELFTRVRVVFLYQDKLSVQKRYLTTSFPTTLSGDTIVFEDGLTVGLNGGGFTYVKYNFFNKPVLSIMDRISSKGENLGSIIKEISNNKGIKPFLYLLTNGERRNSLIIERGDFMQKRKLKDSLIFTNHLASDALLKLHYKKNFGEDQYYQDSVDRYENIRCKLDVVKSAKDAIEILKLNKNKFEGSGSISNLGTVQGIIVLPKRRKIYLPSGNDVPITYSGNWENFNLDELFKGFD